MAPLICIWRLSMEVFLAIAGIAGLAALFSQSKALPSQADVEKALDKLDKNPADPEANTVAGKYKAFVMGDYVAAMPYLVQSKDLTLKTLAEHELDAGYTLNPTDKVTMGDEWVTAAKKLPALNKILYDRASYWYGLAWPDLAGQWKDKARERLRKMFQNPTVAHPKGLTCPTGWVCGVPDAKAARTQMAAHSGQSSFEVVCWKHPIPSYVPIGQPVLVKPGQMYKLSVWALTDDTDVASAALRVHVQNAQGAFTLIKGVAIPTDQPWWKKFEFSFEASPDATTASIDVAVGSKQGVIFLDDFSLISDGKELLKNGSFEDK